MGSDSIFFRESDPIRYPIRYPTRKADWIERTEGSGRCFLRATNDLPRTRTGELSGVHNRRPVHDHVGNALGVVMRILERPNVADFRGVENGHVGDTTDRHAPMILEAE